METYVELGREVRCGVLEQDGRLVCLPLEEYAVDPAHPVRTTEDKLAHDPDGQLRLVAKTPERAWQVDVADPVTERVWDIARTCSSRSWARRSGPAPARAPTEPHRVCPVPALDPTSERCVLHRGDHDGVRGRRVLHRGLAVDPSGTAAGAAT